MQRPPLRGPAKQGRPFSARAVKGGDKQVYSEMCIRDRWVKVDKIFGLPDGAEGA